MVIRFYVMFFFDFIICFNFEIADDMDLNY